MWHVFIMWFAWSLSLRDRELSVLQWILLWLQQQVIFHCQCLRQYRGHNTIRYHLGKFYLIIYCHETSWRMYTSISNWSCSRDVDITTSWMPNLYSLRQLNVYILPLWALYGNGSCYYSRTVFESIKLYINIHYYTVHCNLQPTLSDCRK